MKIKIIIFCVFCSPFFAYAQTQKTTAKEIISSFYSKYDISQLENQSITFEKKNNNWFIGVVKFENNKIIIDKDYLFYNDSTHLYNSLPFPQNSAVKEINPSDYISMLEEYRLDLHKSYGYAGWYKDVINDLEGKETLVDTEIYSLAQAYSAYALSLILPGSDFAISSEMFLTKLDKDCLSQKQIEKFLNVEKTAEKYYYLTEQKNPNFQTLIGSIQKKAANEVMNEFHLLLAFADQFNSKKILPENLYDKSYLDTAKEILESCPPNSIFLSFGDNDFYPLLYLQFAKNIRRDVYVISYNLMYIDRYIYRATFNQIGARGISLSADTSIYSGEKNLFLNVTTSTNPTDFSDVIRLMKKTTNNSDMVISTKGFLLNEGNGKKVLIPFNSNYIQKNQWVLLDIINNLNGRKICFGDYFYDDLKGLNNFLKISNNSILLFDPK